ncbi:MAG: hypothetical protein ACT4RN_05760 [Pseudonocardia sp.]
MATVRITLSVPEELANRIKKSAGEGTVSGWVVNVIENHIAEDAELERQFVEWLEAIPPDEDTMKSVDAAIEQALGPRRARGAA